jgi:hypothetical protein
MKQIVLKYGIIGGIVIATPMFIIIPEIDSVGFEKGETILFTTMIVSFLSIYLGIGANRKKLGGGYIGFRSAFLTGLLITIVVSAFYVTGNMLLFYKISPDFPDKYNTFMLSQMKASHFTQVQINDYTTNYVNGRNQGAFVNAAMMFMKPLTFGLFFTLSSSLILRKKEFTPRLN